MHEVLTTEAQKILQKEFGVKHAPVRWETPREKGRGDVTTTFALQLAKELGLQPREIAQALADGLAKTKNIIEAIEVAGPGYVNVTLKPAVLLKALLETKRVHAPLKAKSKKNPVIVEYSQPNIAKPLGAHHIIGTVIGESLANLYEHGGFPVIRWNYIGDWGTQFGKLAVAFEKWGTKEPADCTLDDLLELYVRFHNEAESDPALEEEGRKAFLKLEQGDKNLRAFWSDIVSVTKKSLAGIYERLHIEFDLDLGESFYEDKMQPVIEEGKKKKVFVPGEGGALIVQFPEESKLPPYLIVKGDGATLYSTRDLAQMRYRIDEYHPSAILICTDVAQQLHFQQLVATCRMLDWDLPEFENVLFGRMRFSDGKMSTRKGTVLKLEHVLDEAVERARAIIKERGESIQTDDAEDLAEMMGTGALVYGILSQNRKMDIVFDWDKMLSFEGNSAPYLQYTHARARSVLRKADEGAPDLPKTIDAFSPKERSLVALLLQFPATLDDARATHMPHKLATYLYELCQEFNGFYGSEPILKAEGTQRSLRLALTSFTATVLKTGAELLTLRVPERM